MQFKKSLLKLGAATLFMSATPAFAGGLILGVKGGAYQPDVSNHKPALMASVQIGYEFLDLVAADIAAELEFSRNLSKGKIKDSNRTLDYQNIAAYISVRSAGPVYVIGRIGAANTKIKAEGKSNNKTAVAVGAGLGFSLGARTEIELTRYELNKDQKDKKDRQAYYLSLGASF